MPNDPHRRRGPAGRHAAQAGLLALSLACVPAAFTGPVTARLVLVGLLVLLGPGGGAVLWMRGAEAEAREELSASFYLTVAMATSLAASLLVATLLVYVDAWHPAAGVCILAAITAALVLASLTAAGSTPRGSP